MAVLSYVEPGFVPLDVFASAPTLPALRPPADFVDAVREVLTGRRFRADIEFAGADFVFYHGCLLGRVRVGPRLYACPTFDVDADGTPVLPTLPVHQQGAWDDFLSLPAEIRRFYFSLLRDVFRGYRPRGRWQDPATGHFSVVAIPARLQAALAEVGWGIPD